MEFNTALYHPSVLPFMMNKFLTIEAGRYKCGSNYYFEFLFRWNKKVDHAGLKIHLEILSIFFSFEIYDNRHWDYQKDTWQENY